MTDAEKTLAGVISIAQTLLTSERDKAAITATVIAENMDS